LSWSPRIPLLINEEGHFHTADLVTFLPTADPLLINGCLLQLGDIAVSRHDVADPIDDMDVTVTYGHQHLEGSALS
jgi:hypothetical protein